MNKPRYSDHNPSSSRQNVSHSTGRSNYGGRRHRGGNKQQQNQGNPIGNWINRRRQRRQEQNSKSSDNRVAVGTEANAIQNMKKNAKNFNYPSEGFITPIEHSLLYAMIENPEHYPEAVVKSEIDDEEFDVYLYVDDNVGKNGTSTTSSSPSQRVSYAQLSALLSLSSEKNPSVATPNQNEKSSQSNSAASNNTGSNTEQQVSIGQALCQKLLKTITRYSDKHGLDRQTEITEFLSPIEKRCQIRNEKAALKQLLPAYAGYTVSLVTGNPLPLLIGAAALTKSDPMVEENQNVVGFRSRGGRVGDLETAGLLDECDSD